MKKILKRCTSLLLTLALVFGVMATVPFSASAASSDENGTMSGELEFNGHSYKIFDNICDTWEEAEEYCESLGGHLATITTKQEDVALYNFMINSGYKYAYFGLYKYEHTPSYTGEWPGIPMENISGTNIYTIDIPKNAVNVIFSNGIYQTEDITISGHQLYGVNGLTDSRGCYVSKDYSGLVSNPIESNEQIQFYDYLDWGKNENTIYAYFWDEDGNSLSVDESYSKWKWVTDEPLDYINWHEGEPNNLNDLEKYGSFYWDFDDGTWNDGDFGIYTDGGYKTFICEWDYADAIQYDNAINDSMLYEQYQAKYYSENASIITGAYMVYTEIEDNYTPTQYALNNILSFGWNKNFGFSDDAKIWEAVILDILFQNGAKTSSIESWEKESLSLSKDLCNYIKNNNIASLDASLTLDIKGNINKLAENAAETKNMTDDEETKSAINKIYSAAKTVKDFADKYAKYLELRELVDGDMKAFLYQMKNTDTYNNIPAFSRAIDKVIENINARNYDLAGLIIGESGSESIVQKAVNGVVGYAVKALLGEKIFGLIDITKTTTIYLMNTICGTEEKAQTNVYLYMLYRIDECATEAFNNAAQDCLSSGGKNSYHAVNGGLQFMCGLYTYGISICRNWIDVVTTSILSNIESGPYTTVKRPHYDMANDYLNLNHKSSNKEKKEFVEKKCAENEKYVDTVLKNQPAYARVQWYHDTGLDESENDCLILFHVENPNGGITIYAQVVPKNSTVQFPDVEGKSGYYTPNVWYTDSEYINEVNGTVRATKNTIFYTRYLKNIIFGVTDGGAKIISVQNALTKDSIFTTSNIDIDRFVIKLGSSVDTIVTDDTSSSATATATASDTDTSSSVTATQSSELFEIPSYISGYEVIEIGDDIFKSYSPVTSVIIPDTVKTISNNAFDSCSYLTIYGKENSYAQTYAENNDFEFVALEDETIVYGDANGDGEINAKDRMMLTRYLAKWTGYESIDKTAADVNNDGDVNAKDRMILTRHLAKWQGYETLPLNK